MTLIIDPNTEKGKTQIEAIGWAQEQMNAVAQQFFEGKHRIMRGIKFEFKFNLEAKEQQKVKVDVFELAPTDLPSFEKAVDEAATTLGFEKKKDSGIIVPGK